MTLEYDIDLDHSVWIPVPLVFPWNGYADAATWSVDLASSMLDGLDAPAEVRQALEQSALAVADVEGPFPGAMERFWHFPEQGGTERLAHLYISEYPDRGEAAVRAVATAGIGGYVQVLDRFEGAGFEEAARTVVVAEQETGDRLPVFAARFIGFAAGMVFIVEVVESNALVLEELMEPAATLFGAIRVRDGAP